MFGLYPTRRVPAVGALILTVMCSARFVFSEDGSGNSGWKAPARAAGMPNPIPADDKSVSIGKSLYVKECASCHGESGRGNGPDAADLSRQPTDFASPAVRQERDGELFWKITEGKKPMPRYLRTFKEEDRWHVINYIRSLEKSAQ